MRSRPTNLPLTAGREDDGRRKTQQTEQRERVVNQHFALVPGAHTQCVSSTHVGRDWWTHMPHKQRLNSCRCRNACQVTFSCRRKAVIAAPHPIAATGSASTQRRHALNRASPLRTSSRIFAPPLADLTIDDRAPRREGLGQSVRLHHRALSSRGSVHSRAINTAAAALVHG